MLRLMFVLAIFTALGACGNLGAKVQGAKIKFGDSRASLVSRLGNPTRVETDGDFTILRYCNTDVAGVRGDALYDFVLVNDTLVYQTNYNNTRAGFCSSFFRPINWAEVKPHYDRHLQLQESKKWETETYNIDLLKVTTFKSRDSVECSTGGHHRLVLEGQISPDSSFAMDRLLDRLEPCKNSIGKITDPVRVSLKSGGGFLKDGFALGQTFRVNQVHAVIEEASICASSCAVAFLGAATREVEDKGQIMFHAPYFSGKNEYGKRAIDCDVGEESLTELKNYYISMTDKETGDRLFERTMWYCSADDGWVVTGGAAAELYGIATER